MSIGKNHSVEIGAGVLRSERLKDEGGRATTLENAGFAAALEIDTLELAPSQGSRWSDPEVPRAFETKSGIVASVNWSGG